MAEKNEKNDPGISSRLADAVVEKAEWLKYVIVGVLAAAVLLIGIVSLVRRSGETARAAAGNALYKARVDAYGSLEADPQAAFEKVARDYAGLPAGAQAVIHRFAAVSSRSDWEAAEAVAREFLRDYSSDAYAPNMRLALGQLLLNAGKVAEAKAELEAVAKLAGATYPEAALALAQIKEREAEAAKDDGAQYEQKLIEAREAYSDITSQARSPQTYWPGDVGLAADFSLLLLNDRLEGYQHPAPRAPETPPAAAQESPAEAVPPAEDVDEAAEDKTE